MKAILFAVLFVLTHATLILLFPFTLSRFLLSALLYGSGTLLMLHLLFHPRSQILVPNRSRVTCLNRPCVALTFDDGPSSRHVPKLLEILKDKGVKATFFVVGRRAEREPGLLRQIHEEGHIVANHTYSHPALFCFLTPRRLREEIERGQEAVQRIIGVRPVYFRSPVGLRHPLLERCLKRAGLEYISWRIRTYDTFVQKPEILRRRIIDRVTPGDIILLHDKDSPGAAVMLDVLPGLIDDLKDRGFDFAPV